jgi:hypothetical protein
VGGGGGLVGTFLHYLLHGAWPYGSALDLGTAPAELLARLIEAEPAALAAMLRRHGRSEAMLQRLVRQMSPALLERLLALLDPKDAAWILTYMAETRTSHAVEPLVDEGPDEFEQLLWTIVLRDALHRAGLRANRRAFLRTFIAGIATAGGLSYARLLAELGRGLAAVPGVGRDAGSLLSIVGELAAEARSVSAPPPPFAVLAAMLEGKASGLDIYAAPAVRGKGPALAEALRAQGPQARWLLRRLLAEDGEALLARLDAVLPAEEIGGLLLPPEPAHRLSARLRAARGRKDMAALIETAAREPAEQTGAAPEMQPPDALARLEQMIGRDPAGEAERWAAALPPRTIRSGCGGRCGASRSPTPRPSSRGSSHPPPCFCCCRRPRPRRSPA